VWDVFQAKKELTVVAINLKIKSVAGAILNIRDAAIRKLARAVFGQRDDAIAAAARPRPRQCGNELELLDTRFDIGVRGCQNFCNVVILEF
jgi:hypothetical protein